MGDWMSSEGVNYITACGHERHGMGSKHPSPPGVSMDGARSDEDVGRDDEQNDWNDDITGSVGG